MAYPTICENCRNDDCAHCQKHSPPLDVKEKFVCGGWFCVCGHGEPESEFQQSVRAHFQ